MGCSARARWLACSARFAACVRAYATAVYTATYAAGIDLLCQLRFRALEKQIFRWRVNDSHAIACIHRVECVCVCVGIVVACQPAFRGWRFQLMTNSRLSGQSQCAGGNESNRVDYS